jgi:HAD superfamily hydrolase (TIGR01549 family)
MPSRSLTAILWDFDSTLADTRARNFQVVRRVMADATGKPADHVPALRSREVYDRVNRSYANWRDLYRKEFGFSEEETDRVGRMWTEYQLADETPAPVFRGVKAALAALAHLPHGIVSMNGRRQIERSMQAAALAPYFRSVVGWEDVDIRRQKPEPDGILACLERVSGGAPGTVLYVGDHETDVRCAARANEELQRRGAEVEVVAVLACFAGAVSHDHWPVRPTFTARRPRDVVAVAGKFPRTEGRSEAIEGDRG